MPTTNHKPCRPCAGRQPARNKHNKKVLKTLVKKRAENSEAQLAEAIPHGDLAILDHRPFDRPPPRLGPRSARSSVVQLVRLCARAESRCRHSVSVKGCDVVISVCFDLPCRCDRDGTHGRSREGNSLGKTPELGEQSRGALNGSESGLTVCTGCQKQSVERAQ
jgi:hypothetical protein